MGGLFPFHSSIGYVEEERGHETPCHIWQGAKNRYGYGVVRHGGKVCFVHLLVFGPVDTGLQVDHLCRQRDCGRRDHLEAVTHAENVRRGASAKLTEREVRAIRYGSRMGLTAKQLSVMFDYDYSGIYKIIKGQMWKGAA